jgi:hypothetical protein
MCPALFKCCSFLLCANAQANLNLAESISRLWLVASSAAHDCAHNRANSDSAMITSSCCDVGSPNEEALGRNNRSASVLIFFNVRFIEAVIDVKSMQYISVVVVIRSISNNSLYLHVLIRNRAVLFMSAR